eukprot:3818328-Pyramimonas_sp.AAC.1
MQLVVVIIHLLPSPHPRCVYDTAAVEAVPVYCTKALVVYNRSGFLLICFVNETSAFVYLRLSQCIIAVCVYSLTRDKAEVKTPALRKGAQYDPVCFAKIPGQRLLVHQVQ